MTEAACSRIVAIYWSSVPQCLDGVLVGHIHMGDTLPGTNGFCQTPWVLPFRAISFSESPSAIGSHLLSADSASARVSRRCPLKRRRLEPSSLCCLVSSPPFDCGHASTSWVPPRRCRTRQARLLSRGHLQVGPIPPPSSCLFGDYADNRMSESWTWRRKCLSRRAGAGYKFPSRRAGASFDVRGAAIEPTGLQQRACRQTPPTTDRPHALGCELLPDTGSEDILGRLRRTPPGTRDDRCRDIPGCWTPST